MADTLVLASGSAIRAKILADAGVDFEIIRPNVHEEAIKQAALEDGKTVEDTAMALAETKALSVDDGDGRFFLGSDQMMAFGAERFDKPRSLEEAKDRLKRIAGAEHRLINAIAIAQRGAIVFRNLDSASLHVRTLSESEIDAYIDEAGPAILSSVGAYQVERLGARLFEKIEGDYFSVLGLALFPVLRFLREADVVAY